MTYEEWFTRRPKRKHLREGRRGPRGRLDFLCLQQSQELQNKWILNPYT
jgi:hypothetical protein